VSKVASDLTFAALRIIWRDQCRIAAEVER
jgi:hypothetical protein